jgi:hypothetical protein
MTNNNVDEPIPPQFTPQVPGENSDSSNQLPKKKDPWGLVIGVNLIIFFVYTVLAYLYAWENPLFNVFTYLFHVGVLLVIGVGRVVWSATSKHSYNAASFFISALLIFIIGFVTCGYAFTSSL